MGIDLQRWQEANTYGTNCCQVLTGEDLKPLSEYPDTSDESVLQYMFDTLDEEKLYNSYLYDEAQKLLDMWLVEDISASDARKELTTLFLGHYRCGC